MRSPLASSLPSDISRPPKRQATPNTDNFFFTPAAESFQPLPYTPHDFSQKPLPEERSNTSLATLATLAPVMDPSPSDPEAVFIRPPFTNFPKGHHHPEGLTYNLMASNPEWFLVPEDFSGHNATPYPSQLEPPRGWCPAKKKDLKDRGIDGWPEGEEPRLRCTFCRRTYAGVNAKSMWRRHVFEKHKVAMSNRRDSNDRGRGRTSTKNKHRRTSVSSKENTEIEHNTLNLDTLWGNPSFSSKSQNRRFRNLAAMDGPCAKAALTARVELSRGLPPMSSNELSPDHKSHLQGLSFPAVTSSPRTRRLPSQSQEIRGEQPMQAQNVSPVAESRYATVPESPYDPLRTPAFRHSPPRLPSDQPWRFPSPSHPLHPDSCDLSFGIVAQDIMPSNPRVLKAMDITSHQLTVTPPKFFSPSRVMFPKGGQLSPQTGRTTQVPVDDPEDSPFVDRSPPRQGTSGLSDWVSRSLLPPSDPTFVDAAALLDPTSSELVDPFADVYSWIEPLTDGGETYSPASSPEIESPVLRSSRFPELCSSDPTYFAQDSGLRIWENDSSLDSMIPTWIGDFDDLELDYPFETFKRPYDASPMRKRRRTYSDQSAASGSD